MDLIKENKTYTGSNNRIAMYDIMFPNKNNGNIILFIHGYMGFKDWGPWNLLQKYFVEHGFVFCKANLSHNGIGTELDKCTEFTDLDCFSKNTYSIEKEDVNILINLIAKQYPNLKLTLIGHSRAGAIVLLNANNIKVNKVICLASISSIEKRYSDKEMIRQWEKDGVRFVENQRTKQKMPHLYIQYLDYLNNKNDLDIESHCTKINKKVMLFHGENDTSVPISEGEELSKILKFDLIRIKNCDHVFGATHPWNKDILPENLKLIANNIINDYK